VEEVDYAKKCDFNLKGKRADFFVLLVVVARKLIKSKEIINKDRLIGKYLRPYRRIKPKNIIVLSQSMVSVFRGMYPDAKIFDLQHGIIHSNHEAYKTETTYLIKNKEIHKIIKNTKKTLKKAISLGGSSLRDFSSSDGKKGEFQQYFYVYGRKGENCLNRNSNKKIIKTIIGNRATFYCPKCQK